eukprot:scaffold135243_cov34-Tisochrysis_lutea.AAC.1
MSMVKPSSPTQTQGGALGSRQAVQRCHHHPPSPHHHGPTDVKAYLLFVSSLPISRCAQKPHSHRVH